jgi:hypothetical protein
MVMSSVKTIDASFPANDMKVSLETCTYNGEPVQVENRDGEVRSNGGPGGAFARVWFDISGPPSGSWGKITCTLTYKGYGADGGDYSSSGLQGVVRF